MGGRMTTAAEKRALVGASKRVALAEPPPPGERAEDELSGAALTAVMDRHFATWAGCLCDRLVKALKR